MPATSERQRRAMWAAAEGHSNLGIPQSVGEEFVKHDAAGKPNLGDLSDYEAAEAIRDGELSSPQKYGDFWLFDLRITGTGMAFRDSIGEWAYRDPEAWTSPEFVQRCNGLPVVFEHPEGSGLNSDYYRENAIGTIILPYVKGDEVWGVAKIFDDDTAELMKTTHRSTSPGVTPPKGAEAVSLEGGAKVLDEGLPLILDHLAVCELGVWDKDGPPEGIRLDSSAGKGKDVAEKTREELEKELDDAKRRADSAEKERDDAHEKLDAHEKADKARRDAEEKEPADKAKRDEEESEKKALEEAEREKKDKARKDRHDAAKHDGSHKDCARCDESEREEEEKKDRKDGASTEEINANREERIADSKRIAELEAKLAEVVAGQKPLSHEDANAVAAAFHRADSVYQMLGEQTPQILPGERPAAYRRRILDGLRKFTKSFKDERIHDSVAGRQFDIIEDRIYAEALEEAKNPTLNDSMVGVLRERVTVSHGKTKREFFGDSRAAWLPFMPPVGVKITRFTKPDAR